MTWIRAHLGSDPRLQLSWQLTCPVLPFLEGGDPSLFGLGSTPATELATHVSRSGLRSLRHSHFGFGRCEDFFAVIHLVVQRVGIGEERFVRSLAEEVIAQVDLL